uniref:Uncharacterized protein n=1 Tax=viral metagenome TaxID=1070528 RepID=A0A6C0JG26_9ZZZZ
MDKDYDIKLNNKEKRNIDLLNKKHNKLNNQIREDNDPINMSIKSLFNKWGIVNIQVFKELVNLISNLDQFSSYFDDIDNTGQWYNGIMIILRKIFKIFSKDDRPIFIGFTFILLSFALYITQITS